MVLTKRNTKSLLGKMAHYHGGDIDIYYYFPTHQEIIFNEEDIDINSLKIILNNPLTIAMIALNLSFGEQIPIIKSVPRNVAHRAIKGIFGIKSWDEEA